MSGRASNLTKNMSTDRILMLEKIEGEPTRNARGEVKNGMFNGEQKMHAIRDQGTNFWKLQMERGLLSETLKQQWTTFGKLKIYLDEYLKRRGLRIKEIIDA